jgi:hypothetical protein
MRAWQDGEEIYVQRDGGLVCHQYAETPVATLPASAVELAIPGVTPAARKAIGQVLDRAAGART